MVFIKIFIGLDYGKYQKQERNMSLTDPKKFYDRKYFEDGIASGKSCYVNYRWIPELTIPMAYFMMRFLQIQPGDTVLDYGCSKGYVVRALRLLGVDAYGVDISDYAIAHCDSEARDFCRVITDDDPTPWTQQFDWIITKDVLEHMPLQALTKFLTVYTPLAKNMFHVIPLGDDGVFRIAEYHADRSHIQINDESWWTALFGNHGWNTATVTHQVKGIKDNWSDRHPAGNGFFILHR